MKAYLAIKYHEDNKNKELIENMIKILSEKDIDAIIVCRDYEKWGEVKFEHSKLMKLTFECIDESDFLLIEFSEKGVGLGIEAGYAYSKGIPIIVIAKIGSDISNTLKGISKEIIFYADLEDLKRKLDFEKLV